MSEEVYAQYLTNDPTIREPNQSLSMRRAAAADISKLIIQNLSEPVTDVLAWPYLLSQKYGNVECEKLPNIKTEKDPRR